MTWNSRACPDKRKKGSSPAAGARLGRQNQGKEMPEDLPVDSRGPAMRGRGRAGSRVFP
jgi:hypothetical protein